MIWVCSNPNLLTVIPPLADSGVSGGWKHIQGWGWRREGEEERTWERKRVGLSAQDRGQGNGLGKAGPGTLDSFTETRLLMVTHFLLAEVLLSIVRILVDVPHGRMDGWIFLFTNGIIFHGVLSIHTVGYYPAIKKTMSRHAPTQMTLTNVLSCERNQT